VKVEGYGWGGNGPNDRAGEDSVAPQEEVFLNAFVGAVREEWPFGHVESMLSRPDR